MHTFERTFQSNATEIDIRKGTSIKSNEFPFYGCISANGDPDICRKMIYLSDSTKKDCDCLEKEIKSGIFDVGE